MRTVLSLFNGMSGCRLALDRAGVPVDTLYYAEIDKHANLLTEHHYPSDISLGDVTKWKSWDIPWDQVDLVTAGFPCQAWSVIGNKLGDKDPRGMLFWTTLDIIKHVLDCNPKAHFMMENVKMKKEFEQYITHHTTQALGRVHKILIDSALVSAQSRKRYYWTNFEVTQPEDKKIKPSDIIEGYDGTQYATACDTTRFFSIKDKFSTLTASYHKGLRSAGRPAVSTGNGYLHNITGVKHRPLHIVECERLQTVPEGFCDPIHARGQAYKCLGNGWTIDVIAHIFRQIPTT